MNKLPKVDVIETYMSVGMNLPEIWKVITPNKTYAIQFDGSAGKVFSFVEPSDWDHLDYELRDFNTLPDDVQEAIQIKEFMLNTWGHFFID